MIKLMFLTIFHALVIVDLSSSYIVNPGPKVIATKGAVWPKTQEQSSTENFYVLNPNRFEFVITSDSGKCLILEAAIFRYKFILNSTVPKLASSHAKNDEEWLQSVMNLGNLTTLNITLNGTCNDEDLPNSNISERYELDVVSNIVGLRADSIWGVLRGLETFSQLVHYAGDGANLRINETTIVDYPRFKHRGLLLDTSRHYIPLDLIVETIDALAYNKMNVLHWHIVDDQSFPYVSKKFPELSEKGAYTNYYVYQPEQVQEVILYGRVRGVRVMPEFDTPGHTRSWGVSHPELLSPCYEDNQQTGNYGPIDPSKDGTYTFLKELFGELREVFKDEYVHLGGDEVDFDCWESNDNITTFMKEKNISTYENLEQYYIQKVVDIANKTNFSTIVWEEVFSNGVKLPNQTIVHVWKEGWTDTMYQVTAANKSALLSACWYLDHLSSGGDWEDFYTCEPYDFDGSIHQQKLVLGGEACMWAEVVDHNNLISRVWPRASAVAERLWSDKDVTDIDDAQKRLEEHVCRMNQRGIAAQPPNAAGFCLM